MGICPANDYSCATKVQSFSVSFDIFLVVAMFSLVTFWMREEVFRSWMSFAIWWVPLTILLTLAGSSQQSQSLPFPSEKGIIDIGMTLVFTIVSVIIILMKRSSLKS